MFQPYSLGHQAPMNVTQVITIYGHDTDPYSCNRTNINRGQHYDQRFQINQASTSV
jgi:hypothetical protein